MKIAYIRTLFFFGGKVGGSVSHISGFTKGINNLGHNLFFISSDKLAEINEKKNPIFVIKPWKKIKNIPYGELFYNFQFISPATKILQKQKPDIIYQRHSACSICGALLAKKLKLPFVLEFNSPEGWKLLNWSMNKNWLIKNLAKTFAKLVTNLENYSIKRANLVIVVSKPLKTLLISRGFNSKKILVNPNGVDLKEIDKIKPDNQYIKKGKVNFCFLGTFGPWHGVLELIKSIKKTAEKEPNIHFILIGDGPLKKSCEKIVKKDKITKFVTFTGALEHKNAISVLKSCDILVSPHVPNPDESQFFGSPTKLFEYMAVKKLIVASDLEQIGEILKKYKAAIFVKPGNIENLSKGLIQAVRSKKSVKEKLAKNARTAVEKEFTWDFNAKRAINLMRKIKNDK
jgi:glycosyltransferase involved in cell wall biosynthesis